MKRKAALFMSLILVISVVLTACAGTKKPDMLTVHVGPDPDTIDPALNSAVDGATLISHAFEGLMILDKDGVPREGQAKSYKVSDDGTTYTFTLRDGLKWSDGTPLTAQDFVYAWNRAIAPETAADYEYIFDIIDGYDEGKLNVTAPDDKTLVVQLKAPVPYFLELCAFPTFFPVRQDIIEQYDEAWAVEPVSYIGNGPYKMTEWVPGSHITFARNENYWNFGALGPEKIKFVLMEDDNAIKSAFENGEILFADGWPKPSPLVTCC
jgi:oligopeptide transport system substrate-binding protein